MSKKKSQTPFSRKNKKGKKAPPPVDENLDRFAGSSDEEETTVAANEKQAAEKPTGPSVLAVGHEADNEGSENENVASDDGDAASSDSGVGATDEPYVTNSNADTVLAEDPEPSEKMAGAMAKILGTSTTNKASSVVLAKTTTPLQRLQQKEKEKIKSLKQKRQTNKERNLAALHIPLSVATSNNIGEERLSITHELEQERSHRRVATRGVVALFNAISQHQNTTEDDEATTRKTDASKLTKHGFLDKIKNAAASVDSKDVQAEKKLRTDKQKSENPAGKWDALKDDFMMKPKKNWDEESSDEGASDFEETEDPVGREADPRGNKRRKISTLN